MEDEVNRDAPQFKTYMQHVNVAPRVEVVVDTEVEVDEVTKKSFGCLNHHI